jgi:hypothetical protein
MDFVSSRWRHVVAMLALTGALFTISSCSDATGPNDYNADLAPGAGSMYAVEFFTTDAFANVKKAVGNDSTGRDTIHAVQYSFPSSIPIPDSLLPFGGIKNIIEFDLPSIVSRYGMIRDRYFRYLSDGNVLVYVDSATSNQVKLDSMWLELPFGTKASRSWTQVDTSWVVQGADAPNNLKVTWTVNFDKVESIVKNNSASQWAEIYRPDPSLTTLRAYVHREEVFTTATQMTRTWSEDTYWFAPKIKYLLQKTHGHMVIRTNLKTAKADTSNNVGYLWTSYYYNVK